MWKVNQFQYFFKNYELQGKLFQNKFDFAIKVVCVLFFIQTTTTKARVSKDKNHFFHGPNVEEWANHEWQQFDDTKT